MTNHYENIFNPLLLVLAHRAMISKLYATPKKKLHIKTKFNLIPRTRRTRMIKFESSAAIFLKKKKI